MSEIALSFALLISCIPWTIEQETALPPSCALSVPETPAAVAAVVLALRLSVVNWAGEEMAQLEVRPDESVLVGKRQIEDQLGVPCRRQQLVFGEQELAEGETWSRYGVSDWSTLQLTTLEEVKKFDLCVLITSLSHVMFE